MLDAHVWLFRLNVLSWWEKKKQQQSNLLAHEKIQEEENSLCWPSWLLVTLLYGKEASKPDGLMKEKITNFDYNNNFETPFFPLFSCQMRSDHRCIRTTNPFNKRQTDDAAVLLGEPVLSSVLRYFMYPLHRHRERRKMRNWVLLARWMT